MDEPGRRRSLSLRARITIAAVLVVGIALTIAAIGVVASLDRSLTESVRDDAFVRARAVAGDVEAGDASFAGAGDVEESFVQLLASGEAVVSSSNIVDLGTVIQLDPGQSTVVDHVTDLDGSPWMVVAVLAHAPDGDLTLVLGRSLEDAHEATGQVATSLVVAIPLLLAVVGVVAWLLVGRALAPVEAIRDEVDTISVGGLDRRVPDPGGDDEVGRLASTMNRMLERLEAGRDRERRFVSDASHELRSPVASIRQHAELALRHPDRTDLPTLAGVANEEALRLQRIVDDLLLLTRIDEGTLQLRPGPVDLDDLVQDEAARLRAMTSHRVIADRVEGVRLEGDRDRLAQVLRNLGENAARHASSTIAIELRRSEEVAILAVDDDGVGVPDHDRGHVFDRFVRLDEARERDVGGSGLGLSIVREIAALHGGTVIVTDGRIGGARFEVRLPAT